MINVVHLQYVGLVFTKDHEINVVKVAPTSSFIRMFHQNFLFGNKYAPISHANMSVYASVHSYMYVHFDRTKDELYDELSDE